MRRVLPALAALVAATLAACAALPGEAARPSGTSAAGSAHDATQDAGVRLPDGVTVDVYQTRTDLPARKIEIAVTNASEEDITIVAAEFVSTQFALAAVWDARPEGTRVRAGTSVDLPVRLAEPACDDPHPRGLVRIAFSRADGRSGHAELPAVDRYDRLPDMRTQECFAASIGAVATLTIGEPVRVADVGGVSVGYVRVAIAPSGASGTTGTFTIDALEDTVLLGLADGQGAAVEELPLDLRVSSEDPPGAFEIPIVPGRCDPHAIAEDKQGTIFILQVTAPDGTSDRVRIAATPTARASIYAYFAAACGLPG